MDDLLGFLVALAAASLIFFCAFALMGIALTIALVVLALLMPGIIYGLFRGTRGV